MLFSWNVFIGHETRSLRTAYGQVTYYNLDRFQPNLEYQKMIKSLRVKCFIKLFLLTILYQSKY